MLLGLTGGIATGKSTVTRLLRTHRAFLTFDADECVHELLASDPGVMAAVRLQFGLRDAPIDRRELGRIVFHDPEARRNLEAILHPQVRARWHALAEDCRKRNGDFLADIPLLFETGSGVVFDTTVVVAASPAIQRQRLADRGLDRGLIEGMLASQWPIGQKIEMADHVIWNDGSLAELEQQCELLSDALFTDAA